MPASDAVRVEGLRELNRAFRLADRELATELRGRLKDAAEPVRADAERLAAASIPRIGLPWSRMRVGVTTNNVYVAPKHRGTRDERRRRRNLAGLLLERSMLPALDQNKDDVVRAVDNLLVEIGRDWERV